MSAVSELLSWADAQKGKPYVWGGTGPDGYDCSGLVQGAFKAIGITLPRISQEQRNAGTEVPLGQIQPGDIVTFTYPDSGGNPGPGNHVAIYAGSGQVIEAPRRGVPVRTAPLDTGHIDRVRRVVGGNGATGTDAAYSPAAANTGTPTAPGLQQAGYDAVINLTPWDIPLNPFKLPGYLESKLGALGDLANGAVGGLTSRASQGMADVVGPIVLATVAVVVGGGLVLIGAFITAKPAIDSAGDTISKFNVK